jgi:hypothetical protein
MVKGTGKKQQRTGFKKGLGGGDAGQAQGSLIQPLAVLIARKSIMTGDSSQAFKASNLTPELTGRHTTKQIFNLADDNQSYFRSS